MDHGYPVRVVTPGITGARAVKWVRRIVPARRESQSQWQQKDYKSFNPGVGWDDVDWSSAPAIQVTMRPYFCSLDIYMYITADWKCTTQLTTSPSTRAWAGTMWTTPLRPRFR